MGKSRVRNFLRPPPSRQGKTFCAPPPFKEWKLFAPPLQYGLNFKLPRKNYPKTFCAPPSAWLKLFSPPPLFVGVKLHVPPLPFCSPPPPPPSPLLVTSPLLDLHQGSSGVFVGICRRANVSRGYLILG